MSTPSDSDLPFFDPGQPLLKQLSVTRLNGLVRYCRASRVKPGGRNILVTVGSGGTGISATVPTVPSFPENPLTIIDSSNTDDGQQIQVIFGTIGGVEPTIGGVLLSHSPAPNLAITGNGIIYSTGVIGSSNTILVDAAIHIQASKPADTNSSWFMEIGRITSWTTTSFKINQTVSGSQALQICGTPGSSTSYLQGLI